MVSLASSVSCGKHTGEIVSVNCDIGGENLREQYEFSLLNILIRFF